MATPIGASAAAEASGEGPASTMPAARSPLERSPLEKVSGDLLWEIVVQGAKGERALAIRVTRRDATGDAALLVLSPKPERGRALVVNDRRVSEYDRGRGRWIPRAYDDALFGTALRLSDILPQNRPMAAIDLDESGEVKRVYAMAGKRRGSRSIQYLEWRSWGAADRSARLPVEFVVVEGGKQKAAGLTRRARVTTLPRNAYSRASLERDAR